MFEVNSFTVGANRLCNIHLIAIRCAKVVVRTLCFSFIISACIDVSMKAADMRI